MLVAAEASSNLLGMVLGPLSLLVVLLFLWSHQVRTERMKHWRSFARQHNLKLTGNVTLLETVMLGRVGGTETRVWMGGAQGGGSIAICTHIRCQIPGSMPPGTTVVPTTVSERLQLVKKTGTSLVELKDAELDGILKCQSIAPIKLRQILTDELVKPLIPKLVKEVRFLEISSKSVKVEVTGIMGSKLPSVVEAVAAFAAKLAEAYEAPYNQLSAQMGLLYKRDGQDQRVMRGTWEDVRVLVRLGSNSDHQGRHCTSIRMGLDSGLPAQFRLIPKRPNQVGHGYARILDKELAECFFAAGVPQNLLNALVKSEEIRKGLLSLHKNASYTTIEQGDLIVLWFDLLGYEIRERILEMATLVLIIRKQIFDIQYPEGIEEES